MQFILWHPSPFTSNTLCSFFGSFVRWTGFDRAFKRFKFVIYSFPLHEISENVDQNEIKLILCNALGLKAFEWEWKQVKTIESINIYYELGMQIARLLYLMNYQLICIFNRLMCAQCTDKCGNSSKGKEQLFSILFTLEVTLTVCNFPSREGLYALVHLAAGACLEWLSLCFGSFSFILIFCHFFLIFYLIRFIERMKSERCMI